MEIVKQRSGDFLDVRVTGRLDNHWSEPFDEAIAEMIREGAHHLRLDLSGVNYLSSAGIGALMKAYRDTRELQGSCTIIAASDRVRTILKLVELDELLFALPSAEPVARAVTAGPQQIPSDKALFESYALDASPSRCNVVGRFRSPSVRIFSQLESARSAQATTNAVTSSANSSPPPAPPHTCRPTERRRPIT